MRGHSLERPEMATLSPVALTDGRYYLGIQVLSDPAHAEDWVLLSALPQVDYADIASLLPTVAH